MNTNWMSADWPAPDNIQTCTTTRTDGISTGSWQSFNLADHVNDRPESVTANRALLGETLALPGEPHWLQQTHSTTVIPAEAANKSTEADASYTHLFNTVCAVLTADCLPLLLCNHEGTSIAAVHAGWRGLCNGVIESTLDGMAVDPGKLLAWMGPAIGPEAYEVGTEVRDAMLAADPGCADCFQKTEAGAWLMDMYALARRRLSNAGVTAVYGGGLCTWSDPDRFYSYRRDGETGRMATLIWMV